MESNFDRYLKRSYSTIVVPDVTTDGEPCYLAYNSELEGCMSHGATRDEALHNLGEVRKLYISTLVSEGLEVPFPEVIGVNWEVVAPADEELESVTCLK